MAYEEAEEEGEEEVWSEMRSSHWLYGTDTKGTMVLLLAVSAYFNMLQAPSVLDLRHLHRHNAHEGLGTASTTGLGSQTAGACVTAHAPASPARALLLRLILSRLTFP